MKRFEMPFTIAAVAAAIGLSLIFALLQSAYSRNTTTC